MKKSVKYLLVFLIGFSVLVVCDNVYAETMPYWIKQTAGMWSENKIDESKFVQALESLAKNGILQIKTPQYENTYTLPKYGDTLLVTISGITGDLKKRNNAFLTVLQPDGKTIELRAAVLETGVYHVTILLNHNSPSGIYKVTGMFSGSQIPESSFYVKQSLPTKIPLWIKDNAHWWADGKISDNDFVFGIQYLIDSKIMIVNFQNQKSVQSLHNLHIDVQGKEQVRRGTMQSIDVYVNDGQIPVSGATVTIRVEDYGENTFEEFKGITDSEGKSIFSWEIDTNSDAETLLVFVAATNGFSSVSTIFTFQVWCLCGEPNCECR